MPPATSTRAAETAPAKGSPRIVHLVPCDGVGGVETAARSAAEAPSPGLSLRLVFLSGPTIARETSRIIDHPRRPLNSPLTFIQGVRTVLELRPDVLVCSLWRSMIVGAIVKILRPRIRLVCFFHLPVATHVADRLAHWLALGVADEAWADASSTLEARTGSRKIPGRVISFVTDRIARVAPPEPAPRFVSWSRLHRQKGHDRALVLIHRLAGLGIEPHLDIWGPDGGARAALVAQTRDLGLEDAVRFRGPLDRADLAEVAADNRFFLQLSRAEGMGMSVVEAMQAGLVSVVTAAGEVGHYVRDGENGIIVDPNDLPAAAGRIAELLGDPGRFARVAEAAASTWAGAKLYSEDFSAAAKAAANIAT